MVFSQENFEKLSEYIYRKSGIYLEHTKHFEKLRKQVEKRSKSEGYESFRKYFYTLRFEDREGVEFEELINAVTVNETYFFRENHQFEILIDNVLPIVDQNKRADEPIRILCAPCSTGEEPYSVAIHLLEDDGIVNERDFEIFGIDIDSNVIEKAKKGLYSDRSVHAIPPAVKRKYFTKKMGFNQLDPDICDAVTFLKANVFDKQEMNALGKFDVIFSRNMLIYFDDASKREVAMNFYNMLNPKGFILLGHAEYMNRIVTVFKPVQFNKHIIYQK